MAEKKKTPNAKDAPKIVRSKQTVRERTQIDAANKPKRLRSGASKLGGKAKRAASLGAREYHLPLPDNRIGRILKKRVRLTPKFLSASWAEIRQVKWPNRRETTRLTIAELIFSIIFGVSVALLDVGLDKLFKEVIIKK